MIGIFCEVYGNTLRNKVLEELLVCSEIGVAVSDLLEDIDISKPKAYQIIKQFEKQEYVIEGRKVGRTQLYLLNKKHPHVKMLMRHFRDCLQLVSEEYSRKNQRVSTKKRSSSKQ